VLLQLFVQQAFAQEVSRQHYVSAKEYIKTDSLTLALIELDIATRISPQYAEAYVLKGYIWELKKNERRAISEYSLAIAQNPNFTQAYLKRAALHFNLKDHRDYVLNDINKAILLNPQDADLYALKAYYYAHTLSPLSLKPDYPNAINTISTAIYMNPNKANYLKVRSEYEFKMEQKLSALADISLAIEKDDTNDSYYHFRGVIKFTMNDYRSALNDLSIAISLNNTSYIYYQLRGNVYYNLAKYDNAYNDYTTTINLLFKQIANTNKRIMSENPLNVDLRQTLVLRGMALVQENKPYDGCDDFKRAVRMGDSRASNYMRQYCQ